MSCRGRSRSFDFDGEGRDSSLARHISRFIGETVLIFTTSGGASGCGFSGVVISVDHCKVRLVTEQGLAPANPLSNIVCGNGDFEDDFESNNWERRKNNRPRNITGSVVDIPIDRIVAFCHNAV